MLKLLWNRSVTCEGYAQECCDRSARCQRVSGVDGAATYQAQLAFQGRSGHGRHQGAVIRRDDVQPFDLHCLLGCIQ